MPIIVLFFAAQMTFHSWAQPPPEAEPVRVGPPAVALAKCKPEARKGKSEELFAREAAEASNFSDHEVIARLMFAETLASGYFAKKCNAPSASELLEGIAWVIMNRVKKLSPNKDDPKPDAVYNVVFAPGQFRTSFSAANSNPYAQAFLCPAGSKVYLKTVESAQSSDDLYKQAKEIAAKVIESNHKSGIPVAYQRLQQYYFPYSDLAGTNRPTWAAEKGGKKNTNFVDVLKVADRPCIEFYRR